MPGTDNVTDAQQAITLEEHWLSRHFVDFYESQSKKDPYQDSAFLRSRRTALSDIGSIRLASMQKNQIGLQVISHAASSIALDLATCMQINDELARTIASRPESFAGFATLPMGTPEIAGKELQRCIQGLGFVGALIDNSCEGQFYDGRSFWPVFEAAQELDVPVYIHPSYNQQAKVLLHEGNYPDAVADTLSTYAWGWHSECALHLLRLVAAGVFDQYPTLKVVLGHMGEMLPFQLDRIIRISENQWPGVGVKLRRGLRQVWQENIWITTSGMFALAPMSCVLRQCRPDRILYSVDYPFTTNEMGLEFLQNLKRSGMVSAEELEGITYKNAEKLLKVQVKQPAVT